MATVQYFDFESESGQNKREKSSNEFVFIKKQNGTKGIFRREAIEKKTGDRKVGWKFYTICVGDNDFLLPLRVP